MRARAEEQEAKGHTVTAASAYPRVTSYLQMAERFRTPKDEAALSAYRLAVDSFHRFARLTVRPKIEVVEVPYEGKSLPAYSVHAENTTAERTPCGVFFDGLDITKELQYLRGVADRARRGISRLIVDGPGTGEAIRFRGYPLRYDYDVPGTAAYEYVASRPDVDPVRVGVLAINLGGYYAPRIASIEQRYKACVAWGAIWDYYATWKRRVDAAFNASMSVPGHHITWVLGVDTIEEALEKLEDYRLDGVVQRMRCAFMVTHGAEDEQVPLKDAEALYNAVGSRDKTLRVFTPEEGGAQHCQRDYLTWGSAVIFD
ncbi:MAG: alpha/beta hydrolase [Chloroflexi bacterium]|nr:alpha/beta hydrolase [Chloroflexota bacterium]